MTDRPQILDTVLDGTDVRALAEFYRELLGLVYRAGDEPLDNGTDDKDWLVLTQPDGTRCLAFQQVDDLPRTTWPEPPGVPMQLHLDMTVPDRESLENVRTRVEGLGGELRFDRTDDEDEPLYVFVDPAGHPFCVFVG